MKKLLFIMLFLTGSCLWASADPGSAATNVKDTSKVKLEIVYKSINTFTVGVPITEIDPTTNIGKATTYTITPDPPHGINLDPATGIIKGTPTDPSAAADYTITAKDGTGDKSISVIKLAVNSAPTSGSGITLISLIGIFVICSGIIAFLLYITKKSDKDVQHALGLPSGSVRAIIAILFVVFFMLLAVIFYFDSDTNIHNTDLSKQIITILGTLVTAVSSFYFGSKATEQAQTNTVAALQKNGQQNNSPVPLNIIQQAILNNKDAWISLYGCANIIAGKKVSQNTTQDLDCIVFIVASKVNVNTKTFIPSTITYISNGITYNIPTDVQVLDVSTANTNPPDHSNKVVQQGQQSDQQINQGVQQADQKEQQDGQQGKQDGEAGQQGGQQGQQDSQN